LRIVRGGSAETASGKWVKFDVELDESDIQRILIANDIAGHVLSVRDAFQLLEAEAEFLVVAKMTQLGAVGDISFEDARGRANKILNKIKDNFNSEV